MREIYRAAALGLGEQSYSGPFVPLVVSTERRGLTAVRKNGHDFGAKDSHPDAAAA